MRRRVTWLMLVLLLVVNPLAGCARRPVFQGQVLDPPRPALDFTLPDQRRKPVRLADLRGRVVVLTFLYTTCPDVCPLVTAKLREVGDLLGKRGRDVAFVAVTVDPERDTTEAVSEYSRRWGMFDRWRFLTGTQAQLEPIWNYYWVGEVRHGPPGAIPAAASYRIGHSSPVHLFDRSGQIRVVFDADSGPPR